MTAKVMRHFKVQNLRRIGLGTEITVEFTSLSIYPKHLLSKSKKNRIFVRLRRSLESSSVSVSFGNRSSKPPCRS